MKKISLFIFLMVLTSIATGDDDKFNVARLPLGDSNRKYDYCAVKLDSIFNTHSNRSVSFAQLICELKSNRIILIGESHTSDQHHQRQLAIIKGLAESGAEVCLALEMFNPSQNTVLEQFVSGKISEDEFMDQSDYFNSWGHNYRYYQPIFNYAREKNIRMFGVNIEHRYASQIGMAGIAGLTPEEQRILPQIDTTDVEHRFFIKASMEGMDAIAPKRFKNIYAAQCLWDAAMGDGTVKVAQDHPKSIVVLLVGSGHVMYNRGIANIIKKRSEFPFVSVIAVEVPDTVAESVMMKVKKSLNKPQQEPTPDKVSPMPKIENMPPKSAAHGMGVTEASPYYIVVRSLADYLWGVPEERHEKYPSFGLSTNEPTREGFSIKRIIPETIAERQGFKAGDIIVTIDGKHFSDMVQFKKYLSLKNWGDFISFQLMRDGQPLSIEFNIVSEEK